MPKTINVATQAPFDFSILQKTIPLPRRESASLLTLYLNGDLTLTDPGGGAAGTIGGAAPAPLAPLGLINQLKVSQNPAGLQTELNFASSQLSLLQNVIIPLKRRVAARTPPSSGAAATYSVFAEMTIPYSLPGDPRFSAQPMASKDAWEVLVTGQSSAANARDAIYTSNTMTFTYATSSGINLSAQVDFTEALPGGAYMEIACSVDRLVIDSTEKSFPIKSVSPGQVPLLFVAQAWNNNARAALPGGQSTFLEAAFGAGETFYSARPALNQVESASRYGIRDGDMPTGAYFIDPAAVFGGIKKIPLVGQSGGVPEIRLRLGTAVTAPAWLDVLTVRGMWTPAGLQAIKDGRF